MGQELLLTNLHRQAGAILKPWQDWIVPWRFSDPDSEYRAVRQNAGLIDVSTSGAIEVRGADRIAFLHNILTNDIKALKPGSGCQAGLVSPTAKFVADLLVLADEEAHWLFVNRSRADETLKTLNRYLITEEVTHHDQTKTHTLVTLQGPKSLWLLQQILHIQVAFQHPLDHLVVTVDSVPVRLIAQSLTGEPGVVLMVLSENAAWLWDFLLQRGRPVGLIPIGWETLNVLRIEAGIPWYGIDMDESTLLPETGLEERAVSYTKGCYVGQEVIARLQTYGSVSRKLMGLVCEGQQVPQMKDPIMKESKALGEITSACFSPALKRPIAMGYVKRPFYEVGTKVTVMQEGKTIAATVVKRPFI